MRWSAHIPHMSDDSPDYAEEDPQEAPEEARGKPYRKKVSYYSRTIESLGLNIGLAEAGRTWMLLPEDVRRDEKKAAGYPMPGSVGELSRIAELKIHGNERHTGACYIRKCRRSLKNRAAMLRLTDFQAKRAEVNELSLQTATLAEQAAADMKAEVERIRVEAAKTLTSMGDINSLAKSVDRMVMEAFIEGRPINGKPVTVSEALDAMGKSFTHVARLGGGVLDDAGKGQAEDEVMKEYVEATKARLKKEIPDGLAH